MRANVIAMGCSAGCAAYLMSGADARRTLIDGTLMLSQQLGATVREARERREDPIAALLEARDGVRLFAGKAVAVERRTERGYDFGEVVLDGLDEDAGSELRLAFQNEFLIARRGEEVVASVPDLIMVVNMDGGDPIPAESLRYGFRVVVVAMPCDPMWRTREGLAIVGPGAFGIEHDYVPIGAG